MARVPREQMGEVYLARDGRPAGEVLVIKNFR